jgi:3-hydroxy-3-methylglutaryl CoA synthase
MMTKFLAPLLGLLVGSASAQNTDKSGIYLSAGAGQFALAVTTNTTLTVPVRTTCAYITVETASVRRTSDGTSASTTNGTLFSPGAQWSDCGPLASYKFTAVSGLPTLDVEYFK